jgi:toxin ParE1/3/4
VKREIFWSPLALARLQEIRAFIAHDDPGAAERVTTRLVSVVQALIEYPLLGRIGIDPDTRELIVGGTPYIILYQVKPKRILIRTVWHAAQNRRPM